VERGEVATQDGADPAGAVGTQFDDAASNNRVLGKEELAIAVDGVHQLSANCLSVAHGKMLVDA
jgi:hypothetical protein